MSKLATPAVVGVSALLGAGIALGAGALGVGGGDGTTTTVLRQAPVAASSSAAADADAPTARDIYERDAPGVVLVQATVRQESQSQNPFGMPQEQDGEATGSGFVIDDDGTILTNEHVVDGATKVRVTFSNERTVDAKVVGQDTSTDVAVLKVDPKGLGLRPLQLGSAKDIQVGDPVLAIGNPYGLDRTLTTGVVSAKQRRITAPDGFPIENVIQTDASINPGNSGGPLLDGAGRVIGINSQIATGGSGSGSVGIGFAVPIDTVKQILPDLQKTGRANIAYLGITSTDAPEKGSLPAELNVPDQPGAWVQSVQGGSPAAKAGIRGGRVTVNTADGPLQIGGDLIVKLAGEAVRGSDDVSAIVAKHKPGETVDVEVLRGKERKTLKVELGRRSSRTKAQQGQEQQEQAPDGGQSGDGLTDPFGATP
ncbi:trypsin-like peptidase domain-containing protein [Patulibacter sp. SYSU D01012]|uniref:S1C family serine protease n=1 Tax=Patulibacter sp. SYSU D01012 TaxID=2817381 RepID=UPI001B312C8A|nr:trypsin-like peptidase domain-containing protein [Patulibacter sp. SYSU D01012]